MRRIYFFCDSDMADQCKGIRPTSQPQLFITSNHYQMLEWHTERSIMLGIMFRHAGCHRPAKLATHVMDQVQILHQNVLEHHITVTQFTSAVFGNTLPCLCANKIYIGEIKDLTCYFKHWFVEKPQNKQLSWANASTITRLFIFTCFLSKWSLSAPKLVSVILVFTLEGTRRMEFILASWKPVKLLKDIRHMECL